MMTGRVAFIVPSVGSVIVGGCLCVFSSNKYCVCSVKDVELDVSKFP